MASVVIVQFPEIHANGNKPIDDYLNERGWSRSDVQEAVFNPDAAVPGLTDRTDPAHPSATGYISANGGYVIVNNSTGILLQVSDRNDPGWAAPWEDPSSAGLPPEPPNPRGYEP